MLIDFLTDKKSLFGLDTFGLVEEEEGKERVINMKMGIF